MLSPLHLAPSSAFPPHIRAKEGCFGHILGRAWRLSLIPQRGWPEQIHRRSLVVYHRALAQDWALSLAGCQRKTWKPANQICRMCSCLGVPRNCAQEDLTRYTSHGSLGPWLKLVGGTHWTLLRGTYDTSGQVMPFICDLWCSANIQSSLQRTRRYFFTRMHLRSWVLGRASRVSHWAWAGVRAVRRDKGTFRLLTSCLPWVGGPSPAGCTMRTPRQGKQGWYRPCWEECPHPHQEPRKRAPGAPSFTNGPCSL